MEAPYVLITILYFATGVLIFLIGLTVLRVEGSSAPSRATALVLFFAGIGPILSATGLILQSTLRPGATIYGTMVDHFAYMWEFYFPSLVVFALSFPREHLVLRLVPIAALFIYFPYIGHLGLTVFAEPIADIGNSVRGVLPNEKSLTLLGREFTVGNIDGVVAAFGAVMGKVHRSLFAAVNVMYSALAVFLIWRRRANVVSPRLSAQMRTVGIGVTASVVLYIGLRLVRLVTGPIDSNMLLAATNVSLLVGGGAVAWAVLRQQFLGIRFIFRRLLLYTLIALLFAGIYLVVVRPISDFFGQYSGVSKEGFETGFLILTVIAFQPILLRVEESIARWLSLGEDNVHRRLRPLSDAVANVTSLEELNTTLRDGLRNATDTSSVAVQLAEEGQYPLLGLLADIGEPISRADIIKLHEESAGDKWWQRLRGRTPRPDDAQYLDMVESGPYDVYAPLFKERRCVGYLGLEEKIYGVPYSPLELEQLATLAAQVSAALENIRLLQESVQRQLFEEELKIARKIQNQLLPGDPPELSGFQLSATTVPSRYVGGDYYDFVLVEDRWLVLVVADVSGKGIPASILTAALQAAVRSNVDSQTRPGEMMGKLNRLLYQNTSESEFATLFYGVVDLESGLMRYANAGHEFPVLVNGSGTRELDESGIVLGCLEEFEYHEAECEIPRSGGLVIYTDGVTDSETSAGEYFGAERLRQLIDSHGTHDATGLCRRVVDAVKSFGVPESQDDVTLMVLCRKGK